MIDVAVVGGGPVGLFLGCRLADLGVSFVVLEAGAAHHRGSRAIGILPPSLERLADLGVLDAFVARGVRIRRAHAYSSRRHLGSVDLGALSTPFPYALSLPQELTEAMLEEHLAKLCVGALRRGSRVKGISPRDDRVSLHLAHETLEARWIVACDGHASTVREALHIRFEGRVRAEHYLMGDFADDTELGSDAAVFLADDGLVESFPLPEGRRRWVVELPPHPVSRDADTIARSVAARTDQKVRAATVSMLSTFGIEERCAETWVKQRCILSGDAAHVVSPFGGQGMNLGWLDAWDIAETLALILAARVDATQALRAYQVRRRRAAERAIRRGAFNRRVGRRTHHPRLRNAAAVALLRLVPQAMLARLFTLGALFPTISHARQR